MTILFIFSPPASYPVFLPPPVRVFPALFRVFPDGVSIVVVPPGVAAVSAAVGPLWVGVGIVVVWLSLVFPVFPGIFAGPLSTAVAIAFAVSTLG
ncbi:MAG: hypothetical protein WBM29_09500, partial [Candidatus Deferrimicrobium sp.]